MASTDFPENPAPEEETTPAEKAANSEPSLQDYSSNDMWDLNRKLTFAGEAKWQDVVGLNHKALFDDVALTYARQRMQERQLELQERQLALRQEAQNFWMTTRERQDQHADQRRHDSTLSNIEYQRGRDNVIIAARTVEPTREEVIQDATAGAINQAVDTVSRAMVDRTQTSTANIAETSAAVNAIQAQSATAQAAYQALANQVAELTGVVQALAATQRAAK